MTAPIDYNIPCDSCIIFPRCIEPNKFSDTFYGCRCPMLEEWIADFNKKDDSSIETPGAYAVVDWYKARTGIKI
jgi:hypothetical protein